MKRIRKQSVMSNIEDSITVSRGVRIILDIDLAAVYGVQTRVLNQAVQRNVKKFPSDFVFRLTNEENTILTRLNGSRPSVMRSQNVIASKRNIRYLPYAFTEHGAIMAANVLRSERAIQMSVFVVRAFIKMREAFAENKSITDKIEALEKKLTRRMDEHEDTLAFVLQELKKLREPVSLPVPKKHSIGF